MGPDSASVVDFCPFSSIGARPKLTKRNSMDSVELWKFSTVKVGPSSLLSTVLLDPRPPRHRIVLVPLQNGENQDSESISRRNKSQISQPGKRKGCSDSQSSDERAWLDSPVDADDITVHVPPPAAVSPCRHAEPLIRKSKLLFKSSKKKKKTS